MRTLITIGVIVFVMYNWSIVSNFVTNHVVIANAAITKWLVDNTPKK